MGVSYSFPSGKVGAVTPVKSLLAGMAFWRRLAAEGPKEKGPEDSFSDREVWEGFSGGKCSVVGEKRGQSS